MLLVLFEKEAEYNSFQKYVKYVKDDSGKDFDNYELMQWKLYKKIEDLDVYTSVLCLGDTYKKVFKKATGINSVVKFDGKFYVNSPLSPRGRAMDYASRIDLAMMIGIEGGYDRDYTEFDHVTHENVDYFIENCVKAGTIAYDYETTGLKIFDSDYHIRLMGVCYRPGHSWIITFEDGDDQLIKKCIEGIFCHPDITKVAHNLKFETVNDMRLIEDKYDLKMRGRFADTMLAQNLIDEREPKNLKALVDKFMPQWSGYDQHIDFLGPIEDLYQYVAIDCDATLRLYFHYEKELSYDDKLYTCWRSLYNPICRRTMALLEYNGSLVDPDLADQYVEEMEELLIDRKKELDSYPQVRRFIQSENKRLTDKAIDEIQAKLDKAEEAGKDLETYSHAIRWKQQLIDLNMRKQVFYDEVNYGSPKQLAGLLYSKEGFGFPLPIVDGEPKASTDAEALENLDTDAGIKVRAYRTLGKLKSTYLENISKDHIRGVIRSSFNQCGAKTGRISSSDPNLQNMPSRVNYDDEGLKAVIKYPKKCFVAPEDHWFVQCDFSQAELRDIADVSNDPTMIQAYKDGIDLHAITGARIADVDLEEMMRSDRYKEFRSIGKTANFGLVYGMSIYGYIKWVKQMTGVLITEDVAEKHKAAVFGVFKKLDGWHRKQIQKVEKYGYVRTKFGQKRHLDHYLNSFDKSMQSKGRRVAINSPIQGFVGQIMLYAIFWVNEALGSKIKICNTIHDSFLFYVPKTENIDQTLMDIKVICEDLPVNNYFSYISDPKVKMKVDFEVSDKSWGHLEEYTINTELCSAMDSH